MDFNINEEVLYKGYNERAKIIGIRALKSQILYDLLLGKGKTVLHVAEEEIEKLPVAKKLVIMELPLVCGAKYMISKDTITTGGRLAGLYANDIEKLFSGISKRVKEDREVNVEDRVVLKEISLISQKEYSELKPNSTLQIVDREIIVSEAMNFDSCVLKVEEIIQKDLFEDVALVRLTTSEGINFYFMVPYDTLALYEEV